MQKVVGGIPISVTNEIQSINADERSRFSFRCDADCNVVSFDGAFRLLALSSPASRQSWENRAAHGRSDRGDPRDLTAVFGSPKNM